MSKTRPQVIEDEEHQRVFERVAAIEVAKASGMVCVRLPGRDGRPRASKVWEVKAVTSAVNELGRHLLKDPVRWHAGGDQRLLADLLLPARSARAGGAASVPGAGPAAQGLPKTDKHDAMWLARPTEWGPPRPCFVPPAPIRELRDYTRARTDWVRERTRCYQRLEKLLEGALIKISSVASKLTTESAKDMVRAMIAGERDPRVLAGLARTRMKAKHVARGGADRHVRRPPRRARPDGTGPDQVPGPEDHPAAGTHPRHPGRDPRSAGRGRRRHHRPRRRHRPGRPRAARRRPAGRDPRHQPGPGRDDHRRDRPGYDPVPHRRAPGLLGRAMPGREPVRPPRPGRKKKHGNAYLRGALGQAALGAARTGTFLGERYRRVARRRGKAKAQVAVARSILTIIWHLLADPAARYTDLGPDYVASRTDRDKKIRNHVRQLQALGLQVTLTPAA